MYIIMGSTNCKMSSRYQTADDLISDLKKGNINRCKVLGSLKNGWDNTGDLGIGAVGNLSAADVDTLVHDIVDLAFMVVGE